MGLKISAPPYLVQLFFTDPNGTGWSENWWWHADDYKSALDDWDVETLGNLSELRLKLICGTGSKLVYVRVSDSTVKRDTLIAAYDDPTGKGTYTPTVGDQSPSENAVLLRLQGTDANKPVFVLKPLRAIPEECIKDGKYDPTAAFTTALHDFEVAFKSKGRLVMKKQDGVAAIACDSIVALHISRRKVGRPFGRSAGRLMRP